MPVETHAPKMVNRAAAPLMPVARTILCKPVLNRVPPCVQASLKVSSPRDPAEREADATAQRVLRMAIPESSVAYMRTESGGVFRRVAPEERETKLQRFKSPYIARFAGCGLPMRKAEAGGEAPANVAAEISGSLSGGSPLPLGVRRFMEPRFRADFSGVRIHTDARAARLNRGLNARAFAVGNNVFFGRDQFQPGTSEGRELIAHELTHTIQQGAVVQRSEEPVVTHRSGLMAQRLGLSDALDYLADKANFIPGFRMLTIVLGVNPINGTRVVRSAANILRAMVEFLPGGAAITQVLETHGVFDRVGAWIEQQLKVLGNIADGVTKAFKDFVDSLGFRDVFDLGGVWDRAKRIFTDPIDRIIALAKGTASGILRFVKDAVLMPLARMAQGTRGYDLLRALLGEDPISGETVPRNAENLIGGFMKFIGQEQVWENIKKGNAIARAWAWFQGALAGILALVRSIPSRITATLSSLTIMDFVTVVGVYGKILGTFGRIAVDFMSWGLNQVIQLLEILVNVLAPGVMPYIRKAKAAFHTIIRDPVTFVGHLVRAGKRGFQLFADNILTHLKTALIQWLVGPLAEAGVYIPRSFGLLEIVKLVLSVLGLTWQNIRAKLVKIIPEPVLVALEKTASILVTLVKDGPAAAWEQIKAELAELKDQLIEQVTQMISTEVVKAAVTKIATMLNPAGAVVQAIIATYNAISFFIEKIQQIGAVVASFIDSIAAIAAGQVESAAKKVEQAMSNTLVVVLGFLAKLVGLGGIPKRLADIIKKIRKPIDKGLDKIVDWLGKGLSKLGGLVAGGVRGAVASVTNWWRTRRALRGADGRAHSLYFNGEGAAARVTVASNPMPVEDFLTSVANRPEYQTAPRPTLIQQVRDQVAAIRRAQALPPAQEAQAAAQIESTFRAMGPLLEQLIGVGPLIATEASPLPMDYPKRRWSLYPVIYVGPRAKNRIPQTLLRARNIPGIEALLTNAEKTRWAARGRAIEEYRPTQRRALPEGGETVGVAGDYRTEPGKRIRLVPGNTQGGGLINAAFQPYGYRARSEAMDGDHVIEMQLGGPNILENLWPLDASENRSGGSRTARLVFTIPGRPPVTMDALKTQARSGMPTFLIITRTL